MKYVNKILSRKSILNFFIVNFQPYEFDLQKKLYSKYFENKIDLYQDNIFPKIIDLHLKNSPRNRTKLPFKLLDAIEYDFDVKFTGNLLIQSQNKSFLKI